MEDKSAEAMEEEPFARNKRSRLKSLQGDKYVEPKTDTNTVQKILLKGYPQNCQVLRDFMAITILGFVMPKDHGIVKEIKTAGQLYDSTCKTKGNYGHYDQYKKLWKRQVRLQYR